MRYLFVFLLVGLMVSCGGGDASGDVTKEKQAKSTVKIGDLEVMTEDLGKMNWYKAVKACAALGDGWRLPTSDELNVLHENKEEIGGFEPWWYWSSTEDDINNAWAQFFSNGFQNDLEKLNVYYVRAVRAF